MTSSGMTTRKLLAIVAAVSSGMVITTAFLTWWLFAEPRAPELVSPTVTTAAAEGGGPGSSAGHSVAASAAGSQTHNTKSQNQVGLPGTLVDLAVAANGRMLILRIRGELALLIYDVSTRKVVGRIPFGSEPVSFAAGREKLVLGLWGQSAIQRWDLATLTLEAERLVVGEDAPISLAMGADSAGPVLAVKGGGGSQLLDLETLQALEIEGEPRGGVWKHYPTSQLRASADGRVFCAWDFQSLVAGTNVLTLIDGQVSFAGYADSVGHVCPNGIGSHLLTAIGRYRIDERPDHRGEPPGFLIPAVSGPFFVRIQEASAPQRSLVSLFSADQTEPDPLAVITEVEFPHVEDILVRRAFDTKLQIAFPPDRRLIPIPAVNEIVTISADLQSLRHWVCDFARWE